MGTSAEYIREILSYIKERQDYMIKRHCKVLFIRMDVRFPKGYPDENRSNDDISKLMKSLKEFYEYHGVDMHYVWAREQDTSDLPHYHIILLVNGSVIQNPMGIFQKAEQIWNRITGVSYRGLIHFCDHDQENGSVMIRRPTKVAGGEDLAYQQQIFSAAYAEALRRGSYLAKTHTKDIPPPHRGRRFGGSQL